MSNTAKWNNALSQGTSASDYTLNPDFESVWITVNNISVWVKRKPEGVEVDLLPLSHELREPIAVAYASYYDSDLENYKQKKRTNKEERA